MRDGAECSWREEQAHVAHAGEMHDGVVRREHARDDDVVRTRHNGRETDVCGARAGRIEPREERRVGAQLAPVLVPSENELRVGPPKGGTELP